ncbi:hypothetical protein Q765_17230 [Flavobacterium rivuli WB 3.3-2 = DSM 21788]|uniref:WG repeat-containing protein n=2 Tax=Flavobacterium rivuli TaxID=498301 RepID=A0A0A2LXY7_9FLAO|nr:WG repeat-containing protein [Flavobacterium rivuli]KGO85237.1 hypothetical protein Q765_17230 [Flavobacterium rivuli WB 3.3-2 = DSM 21788]
MSFLGHSQDLRSTLPFDLTILERQAIYADDIMPKGKAGKFIYINTKTGKAAFKGIYDSAYPFVKNAAVVVVDGKHGIIDRTGKWLVKPFVCAFVLPSYEDYIAIFRSAVNNSEGEFTYNLRSKKANDGYIYCEKAAGPQHYFFKDGKGPYGVKNLVENKILIKPQYDSIYGIYQSGAVLVRTKNIGIVNLNNEIIVPLEYDNITRRGGNYPMATKIIGLHKNNTWEYFDLTNLKQGSILKSTHKCYILEGLALKDALGIYKEGNKYNILFKDGSTLPTAYDWISDNGLIAINNGNVYILNNDKSAYLYYEK